MIINLPKLEPTIYEYGHMYKRNTFLLFPLIYKSKLYWLEHVLIEYKSCGFISTNYAISKPNLLFGYVGLMLSGWMIADIKMAGEK